MPNIAPIPGNERALKKLRELLDSKQAIAFVGAGVSYPLYPLWGELIQKLADEAVSRGFANNEDKEFWLTNADKRPQQVVRGIKEKLGNQNYGAVLREIFRPKVGTDGNRFTQVHSALLRMPFRGYATTNYDPGLIEARRVLRSDIPTTGYTTHKDIDNLQRWFTGDIFGDEQSPILFAHGIYERSDTVVLGIGEYRDIYKAGLYKRAFEKLWGAEHLVFVGFGFSDSWIDVVAEEIITQTARQAAGEPRHVAIIGLPEIETYTQEMRKLYADQYNAEVYFYPVIGHDHSALLPLLESLAAPAVTAPTPVVTPPRKKPSEKWTHETTNDELYVERGDTLAKLNRWTDDQAVRAIAITGMGGLGKTALIGHWLKEKGGNTRREYAGLFYWSFYANRQVQEFFVELLKFAEDELKARFKGPKDARPLNLARALLREVPLLIVLDGLEVLQERPGTAGYGTLLEDELREFLDCASRVEQGGLIVLTSRFPFTDLSRYTGLSLRHLDLDQLADSEGAALLAKCDVHGTEEQRKEVSRRLDGHPLALRVFAATLAATAEGDPTREFDFVFSQALLQKDQPLHSKLSHLLTFYEKKLSAKRVLLLGILALFRSPVEPETIETLARKLPVTQKELGGLSREEFEQELNALGNEHLVLRDHDGGKFSYSCHPVLRDHFRGVLLGKGKTVASGVADFLSEQPAGKEFTNINELEPILMAIELLLEAGDFKRADELYTSRLYSRSGSIFLFLAAPHEGMNCEMGFVSTPERRAACRKQLSESDLAYYLNSVGVFAMHAGELEAALLYLKESAECYRSQEDRKSLSRSLQNYSQLLTSAGRLAEVSSAVAEALALARDVKDDGEKRNSLSKHGDVLDIQGHVAEAMAAFAEANEIEKRIDLEHNELYSFRGVSWADLLIRLERWPRARQLTEANLKRCEKKKWYGSVACCHWILGRIDTEENQFSTARDHLSLAESTMRKGHMLLYLPEILLAQANLALQKRNWEEALCYAVEPLDIAAPRGLKLAHADALVMRGRVVYERELAKDKDRNQIERARDDANDGLTIALECGYAWAERDALCLMADTSEALDEKERALAYRRDADTLAHRLTLDT